MGTLLDVWKPARESQWRSLGAGWGRGGERLRYPVLWYCFLSSRAVSILLLLRSASSRDVFWAREPVALLHAAWSLRESWWLCTILANCHGAVGRGGGVGGWSAFPTGAEAVALSTFCSSTKLICLKETVVSSSEDLCHLTFASCSVIVYVTQ